MHADAEAADELLAALLGGVCFVREQDEAGACAPRRPFVDSRCRVSARFATKELEREEVLDKLSQRLEESRLRGDERNGGALATGDDERITLRQLLLGADFKEGECGFGSLRGGKMVGGGSQKIQVLREAALEREHSDREAHHDGGVEGGRRGGTVVWWEPREMPNRPRVRTVKEAKDDATGSKEGRARTRAIIPKLR